MELNKHKFSLAAATTLGIVYLVCALVTALWTDAALQLFGWIVHLTNVEKFAGDVQMTFGGALIGLFQTVVYTYLTAYLFAWLHNYFGAHKTSK